MTRKIFVNLPVHDLERAKAFFSGLGFELNPQFTDANAACMVVNQDAFVMLLVTSYFKTFTRRELCDTRTHTEGLFAVSCDSRAAVDAFVDKALASGGAEAMAPQDHGFMYNRSFYDLDGHHWEVLWMDPSAVAGPA